jgi:hypothetical protein
MDRHHHLAALAQDMGYNEDTDRTSDNDDEYDYESNNSDWDESNEWDGGFDGRFNNIKVFSETEDLLLSIERAKEDVNEHDNVKEIVGDIVDNLLRKAVATKKIDFEEKEDEQKIPEKHVDDDPVRLRKRPLKTMMKATR